MRAAGAIVAAACLTAGTLPAFAQDEPPIGSRLGSRRTIAVPHDRRESVRAAHRLAGCQYTKNSNGVRAALSASDPGNAARQLEALQYRGTCINLIGIAFDADSQRSSIPSDVYRGMLAEAALRQQLHGAASTLAPLPRQPNYAAPWFAATKRPTAVDELGLCVAETNPAGVRALLATEPEGPEETRALAAINPSLAPCLTTGATLNANRQSLRAALAEALYHRAADPAAPAAVTQ